MTGAKQTADAADAAAPPRFLAEQRTRRAVGGAVIDGCCVLAFVVIGRHAHNDGETLAGIWHTAWPFLVGLLLGLLAARTWRRPAGLVPAGIGAWLGAAGLGMVIRVLAGQGTAAAFIAVTLAFLALLLLGWRVIARALVRLS
jgi:FtsH-binding integral membrane protein